MATRTKRPGAIKKAAYVDSSAFIAFLDRSDSYFPLFSQAFVDPPALLTTPLVIAECHGWFLRRYDRKRARQFLAFIGQLPVLTICQVGDAELAQANAIIDEFDDQSLTLVDALGLALLRRYRLKICWSTDRHLGLVGAQLLINLRR